MPPPAPAAAVRDAHGDPLPAGAVARFGSARFRHVDVAEVHGLAWSPDGRRLASAGGGWVRVWDVPTGKPGRALEFDPEQKLAVHFPRSDGFGLPPGRVLLVVVGRVVHWWDVETGRELGQRTLGRTDDHQFHVIAFSPGGRQVAVMDNHSTAVWDVRSGEATTIRAYDQNTPECRRIWVLAFSPDGGSYCFIDGNMRLVCCDARSNKLRWEAWIDHPLTAREVFFSPDSRLVALARKSDDAEVIECFAAGTGERVSRFRIMNPLTGWDVPKSFAADSRLLLALVQDDIRVWDSFSGEMVRGWRGGSWGGSSRRRFALSPDCRRLAYIDGNSTIDVHDAITGRRLSPEPDCGGVVGALALSADGGRLAVSTWPDWRIRVWGRETQTLVRAVAGGSDTRDGFTFAPGGRELLIKYDTVIRTTDLASGRRRESTVAAPTKPPELRREYMGLQADGRTVVAVTIKTPGSGEVGGTLQALAWDRVSGEVRWRRDQDTACRDIELSSDGATLAAFRPPPVREQLFPPDNGIADEAGTLVVIDVRDGRHRHRSAVTTPSAIQLTPDGRWLAFSQADRNVDPDGGPRHFVNGRPIWPVDDRRWRVRLLEVATGQTALELPPMPGVRLIRFAPQGRLIAVAGVGEIRLYGALGQPLGAWKMHTAEMTQLAFTPDDRALVTGHCDGTALLWDLTPYLKPAAPAAVPFDRLWDDLAADAATGYRAVTAFADRGPEAAAFLTARIRPAVSPTAAQLRQWGDDLGDPSFAVREAAARNLRRHPAAARPVLEPLAQKARSAEARRRAADLLALPDAAASMEDVRQLRAAAALARLRSGAGRQ